MSTKKINVTVWNEFIQERTDPPVKAVYPEGIHAVLKGFLEKNSDFTVRTATYDQPEHGLTEEVVASTDVMLWWSHLKNEEMDDAMIDRVHRAVLCGMGLIVLHSGLTSKIFQKLLGTSCSIKWREDGERERLWVVSPAHPIAAGLGEYVECQSSEMYGEPFDVPAPDELVFISWFAGGEVFRSGCCWQRGYGKMFFFGPGHETFPTYYQPEIQKIIVNAVRWATPTARRKEITYPNTKAIEKINNK